MAPVQGGTGQLDKNAFLSLLTTQLQYQDPLKPMDDTQFIAQLAQFSSLEQMQQMNNKIDQLATSSSGNGAIGFLGRKITAYPTDGTTPVSGTVSAIEYIDGQPKLMIGTQSIDPSAVISVQ